MKKIILAFFLLVAITANAQHTEFKHYGFYCVIDYTFMTNLNKVHGEYIDNYVMNGSTVVAGWQWRKESAVGLGVSYLNDPMGSFSQIPVFIEYRSHFLRNRLTPYTAVQLGYSIPLGTKNPAVDYTRIDEGGITAGFEVGARLAISAKFGLNLFYGYQLIQCNSIERGFDGVAATRLPELYHHMKFGLGLNF